MIKFSIKNFFKGDSGQEVSIEEQEVSVEVEVEVPCKTRKELFEEAVQKETRNLLRKDLQKALFILVHGEEVWEQTDALGSEVDGHPSTDRGALKKKYPKARLRHDTHYAVPDFDTHGWDLLDYLTDKAMGVEGDTETQTEGS